MKAIVSAVVIVISATSAQAHTKHAANTQCFENVDALRKAGIQGHAWRTVLNNKECWHVHEIQIVHKAVPHETAPKKKVAVRTVPHIEPDEQLLRSYLGLDCNVWMPMHTVICHLRE